MRKARGGIAIPANTNANANWFVRIDNRRSFRTHPAYPPTQRQQTTLNRLATHPTQHRSVPPVIILSDPTGEFKRGTTSALSSNGVPSFLRL